MGKAPGASAPGFLFFAASGEEKTDLEGSVFRVNVDLLNLRREGELIIAKRKFHGFTRLSGKLRDGKILCFAL